MDERGEQVVAPSGQRQQLAPAVSAGIGHTGRKLRLLGTGDELYRRVMARPQGERDV